LSLIVLLAAILRFASLGAKNIWSDEAFSLYIGKLPWDSFWRLITTAEANMAIYYVLLRPWLRLSDAAWWVRLLSALVGVAAVPVVYWIGRELLPRRAGLIAALLLAINPFDIRYSQEARSYSLVVLLVGISFLSFFRCMRQRSAWWTAAYVVSSTLALYAHFFAVLALVAQLVSLALLPRSERPLAIRQAALTALVCVLGVPLLWFVLFRNSGQLNWAPSVRAIDFYHFLLFLTGSGLKFAIALLAFAVAVKMWISRARAHWTIDGWMELVLVLWLFLPIVLTLLVSIWKPVYAPRFLLFCLPAALLLIADGLAQISSAWIRYALIALFVAACIGPIRAYYEEPGQEDWKAAVGFLSQNAQSGDVAWLANAYCALPLSYALGHATTVVPKLQIVAPGPSEEPQPAAVKAAWMIRCSATKSFNAPPATVDSAWQEVAEFRGVRILRLK
jgi:uncharacterized membrane protein